MIIYVRLGFSSHYLDCSTISPIFSAAETNHAVAIDEWGGQFCEDLGIEPQDIQIRKNRFSAFYGTDLELIFRANQIETMILAGVATNNAVELTAIEAHDRDYRVQVMKDTTECASDEEQMASLNFLSRIAAIRTTKELIL
ncbi:MAG: cysteine hydrolase [Simkaniaceae bacterium]|nr:cysteine hydrolase [Simkaniaceae bacterium]